MYKLKLGLIVAVCASTALLTGCYSDTGYYSSPGYNNYQYRRTVPVYPQNYQRRYYNNGGNQYSGTIDGSQSSGSGWHPGYGNSGGNQYEGRILDSNSGGNQYN